MSWCKSLPIWSSPHALRVLITHDGPRDRANGPARIAECLFLRPGHLLLLLLGVVGSAGILCRRSALRARTDTAFTARTYTTSVLLGVLKAGVCKVEGVVMFMEGTDACATSVPHHGPHGGHDP